MYKKRFVYSAVAKRLLLFSLLALLTACGQKTNWAKQADELAVQYMQYVAAEDFDKAVTLFPPKERDQALSKLNGIHAELGRLAQKKLTTKEVNTVFRGKFFIYEYATEYEHYSKVKAKYSRYHATDVLTIFYDLSEDNLAVVSHMVSSDGLH